MSMRPALHWSSEASGAVRCGLCAHRCLIQPGKYGICGVRPNISGKLYTKTYGRFSSVNVEPIEKKPFFHFHPRSNVLSMGGFGCNLNCDFCQNWDISQDRTGSTGAFRYSPRQILALLKKHQCNGVAWTYNEPTMFYEFILETAKLLSKKGYFNLFVSNGYIETEPFNELAPYLDAVNIDIKGYNSRFYKTHCYSNIEHVKQTCLRVKRAGLHLELSYLLIPGMNDDPEDIDKYAAWVAEELGSDTAIHLLKFYPAHNMMEPEPTSLDLLERTSNAFKAAGLNYVYVNNIQAQKLQNTVCPNCGEILIYRTDFLVRVYRVQSGRCPKCQMSLPIIE